MRRTLTPSPPGRRLKAIAQELGEPVDRNRIYYLATLPSLYPQLITGLGELERRRCNKGWGRIIVEKPFGTDLDSAVALNRLVARYFRENQVFRIDHYLGKETVQNIMVFRFANEQSSSRFGTATTSTTFRSP